MSETGSQHGPQARTLRVIDFGRVSPLRSQTLWHAIAYGVTRTGAATLSFTRPGAPYVCLGYHRRLEEIDRAYCRQHDLPVYRRMVGGGPVYLDDGQLFFQLCLPVAAVPSSRVIALRQLLQPAVAAFRAVGIPAELDADGEICLGDRKICGHGAGQIEDAVVVCGNLIERFDHERATRVLGLSDLEHRAQTERLMRRYVCPTPADAAGFRAAMTAAYAEALGLDPRPGDLTAAEADVLAELDDRFSSAGWLAGEPAAAPSRPIGPATNRQLTIRQVKIRSGIWTVAGGTGGSRVVASIVRDRVDRVTLADPGLNGSARTAERALTGVPLTEAAGVLARFGEPGRRLATVFALADRRGL